MQPPITRPTPGVPGAAAGKTGPPQAAASQVHLRVSQINGCAACTVIHARALD